MKQAVKIFAVLLIAFSASCKQEQETPSTATPEKASPTPKSKEAKQGDKADAKKEKKDTKSASTEPASSGSDEQKIDIPIPLNEPVKDITIPHYNEKGELAMQFNAETAQRTDESNIEMHNLKMEIYEDNKKYYIEMPHSVFNLDTRILTSDTPAIIRREDFEIVGQTAEFNTKTRYSRMVGKVKMTLFNVDMNEK